MNIAAVYERPLIGALIELISIVVIIESRNSDKNAYNSESERVNLCPLLGTIEDPLSPGVLRRVREGPHRRYVWTQRTRIVNRGYLIFYPLVVYLWRTIRVIRKKIFGQERAIKGDPTHGKDVIRERGPPSAGVYRGAHYAACRQVAGDRV